MKHRRFATAFSSLLVFAVLAPAQADDGFWAPFCANGEITLVYMDFGDGEPAPADHSAACHGPCLSDRRAVLVKRRLA